MSLGIEDTRRLRSVGESLFTGTSDFPTLLVPATFRCMTADSLARDLTTEAGTTGALAYLIPRLMRCRSLREAQACMALIRAVLR